MKTYALYQNGELIADKLGMADTFVKRFFGLMPRKSLASGEGLMLKKCSSIHCFFMKFTIDAVYLDKDYRIIAKETVRPWHLGGRHKGAKHVIELQEGAAKELETGKIAEVKEI